MQERENKHSSSSWRKEELVTIFTDKQKIFMGLWHSGQLHWFCIPAFIVGSNPTSSTYFIELFTNYYSIRKHFG